MGVVFSALFARWFGSREHKIVMVGLDNAGKSTLLYRMALGEVIASQPTVGSNVETVRHKGLEFQVWDLGGQTNLRPFWSTYYKATDAVVMVVDSTDRARAPLVKKELFQLLDHEELRSTPILVFANKQDLKDAMSVDELSNALSLPSIRGHDWHIQACCAINGSGLVDGLEWISQRTHAAHAAAAKGQQHQQQQAATAAAATAAAAPAPAPARKGGTLGHQTGSVR